MTDITTNGFIVHDNEGVIHGYGATADAAWADLENTMQHANIELLTDEEDTSDCAGSWARASDFRLAPATAALLQQVEDRGGACSWGRVGRLGIACTVEEEEG